jgi:hypothetical protein
MATLDPMALRAIAEVQTGSARISAMTGLFDGTGKSLCQTKPGCRLLRHDLLRNYRAS